MMSRQRRNLEVISISALDLFASALGVFILMSIVLFPYYLRQPSTEKDLQGARANQTAAGVSLADAQQIAREATETLVVANQSPSFFQSVAPALSIAQAIISLLVSRDGEESLERLQTRERFLRRFGTYWDQDETPTGPRR